MRINLDKKLSPGVWIIGKHGKFFQKVEYEVIPHLCFKSVMVEYKIDGCHTRQVAKDKAALPPLRGQSSTSHGHTLHSFGNVGTPYS